jgi:hypothetical protein
MAPKRRAAFSGTHSKRRKSSYTRGKSKRSTKRTRFSSKKKPRVNKAFKKKVLTVVNSQVKNKPFVISIWNLHFVDSVITTNDFYPLLKSGQPTDNTPGCLIPRNLAALEDNLTATYKQIVGSQGVELAFLRVHGTIELVPDWPEKGSNHEYLDAHIWVVQNKDVLQATPDAAKFLKNRSASFPYSVYDSSASTVLPWTGSEYDTQLPINSHHLHVLAHKKVRLYMGSNNKKAESTYSASSSGIHRIANFSFNLKHPKRLYWKNADMNMLTNSGTQEPENFNPYICFAYHRPGGIDSEANANMYANYKIECGVRTNNTVAN